jgi:hypothetical protein
MANSKTRKILLICCTVTVILMVAPSTSQACEFLDRLMPWNWGCCGGGAAAPATYAPAYSVQYPVQTCNYVPQTCYRTVMRTVPTTVCQPVSCCDPCTGCMTTSYRPVTSYVRSAQLVPYTTYRPVWSTSYCSPCATPCATTCATDCGTACGTACGPTTYASPSSGCTSCAPAATTTAPPASSTAPSLPSGSAPSTFQQQKPIQAIPENNDTNDNSTNGPALDSASYGRMTARPVRHANFQSVSNTKSFDYGGWRASNK